MGSSNRRGHRAAAAVAVAAMVSTSVTGPAPGRADSNSLTELVDTVAQRLEAAEPVAAFKWNAHLPVEDPARVRQELTTLSADATAAGTDPDYVTRVFGDQINATEAIEYSRFAEWKLNPASVPPAPPDLSATRSAIDSLNHVMLTQIGQHWNLLRSSACITQLDDARNAVTTARRFDSLYQRALSFAARSYC